MKLCEPLKVSPGVLRDSSSQTQHPEPQPPTPNPNVVADEAHTLAWRVAEGEAGGQAPPGQGRPPRGRRPTREEKSVGCEASASGEILPKSTPTVNFRVDKDGRLEVDTQLSATGVPRS